jgi:hypothetical protein
VSTRPFAEERGVTIVELLVSMLIGIAVLGAIVQLITTTARSSGRVTERVTTNQLARPNFLRLMSELHSTCVSPGVAPVQAGSDDDSITFIHQVGRDVTVKPNKRTVTLNPDGTLTDTLYLYSSGSAPDWTFSSTPTQVYRLLERVSPIGSTPVFRYYAYQAGVIDEGDPLPTPLSDEDAAKTVLVDVSFEVAPAQSQTSDEAGAPVQLTDSALLRFSPSNEDTDQAGLPCT